MADALLKKVLEKKPIDWGGGHDLQAMGARRKEYIAALRKADGGNYTPLFAFAGIKTMRETRKSDNDPKSHKHHSE